MPIAALFGSANALVCLAAGIEHQQSSLGLWTRTCGLGHVSPSQATIENMATAERR